MKHPRESFFLVKPLSSNKYKQEKKEKHLQLLVTINFQNVLSNISFPMMMERNFFFIFRHTQKNLLQQVEMLRSFFFILLNKRGTFLILKFRFCAVKKTLVRQKRVLLNFITKQLVVSGRTFVIASLTTSLLGSIYYLIIFLIPYSLKLNWFNVNCKL